MTVRFEVKMTQKAMFDFMLYSSYTSTSGIIGVILGVMTLVLGVRQLMGGAYSSGAMLLLFAAFFLIGNPMMLRARAAEQVAATPMFQKPICYEMTEEGVRVSQEDQSVVNEWQNFRKAVSTKRSLILYVTKVRALIFPKECLGEQYPAAVKMISAHMPPSRVKIRNAG